jgi:hypothetical protein
MFSDSQYLYAEQRDIAGSGVALNVYYLPNGAAFRNLTINQDIVSMYSFSADSLLLFTNSNGVGHALFYNIPNNQINTAITLPAEKIFSALQISPTEYLIAMQNQVYVYTTNSLGNVSPLLSIPAAPAMKFDTITNQIFIASNKNLNIYNASTFVLKNTLSFADTLKDIAILHSR